MGAWVFPPRLTMSPYSPRRSSVPERPLLYEFFSSFSIKAFVVLNALPTGACLCPAKSSVTLLHEYPSEATDPKPSA